MWERGKERGQWRDRKEEKKTEGEEGAIGQTGRQT